MQNLETLKKIAANWAIFDQGAYLPEQNEWVFYGGSFDPWHEGHSMCLQLFYQLKHFWPFVIPDRNPHKEIKHIDHLWEYYQKLAPEIEQKELYIYPGFILSNQKNPTYNWIKNIAQRHPTRSLGLLLGFDSFQQLPQWAEYKKLLQTLSTLYIVSRQEADQDKQLFEQTMQKEFPHLKIFFLGHHPYEHLSSTQKRLQK